MIELVSTWGWALAGPLGCKPSVIATLYVQLVPPRLPGTRRWLRQRLKAAIPTGFVRQCLCRTDENVAARVWSIGREAYRAGLLNQFAIAQRRFESSMLRFGERPDKSPIGEARLPNRNRLAHHGWLKVTATNGTLWIVSLMVRHWSRKPASV